MILKVRHDVPNVNEANEKRFNLDGPEYDSLFWFDL